MTQEKEKTEAPAFQVVDKRHFVNLGQIDKEAIPVERRRYPSYVEELMTRMAETERRFQEKKKQFDEELNRTKTRLDIDFNRRIELEKQKIVLPLLEILDNLQRAVDSASQTGSIEHLLEGIQMTASLFRSKLQSLGIEIIPVLNQPFDPNLEQAVGRAKVEDPNQDGVVVEEVQPGYSMNGKLLRPAQVRVGHFE